MSVEDCIRSDLILISARGQQIDISTLNGESKHVTPEIDSRPSSPTKFRCITSGLTHPHTMVCLCGYDANSDHCHFLSMPPSPNDFYENLNCLKAVFAQFRQDMDHRNEFNGGGSLEAMHRTNPSSICESISHRGLVSFLGEFKMPDRDYQRRRLSIPKKSTHSANRDTIDRY